MSIAVSASSPDLNTDVDPRFGRCQCFIISDPENMSFEVLDNTADTTTGGAGIATAQMLVGKGIKVVLTGNCGPNAYQVLSGAGIKIVTGVSGKVKDAIDSYKAGKLQPSSQPNVTGHFGMGYGSGMGRGMHRGRRW